jgi:predicted Fe-Mo cluster-binding NifX family protein
MPRVPGRIGSQTISQHFGRAPYYLVFTLEDGQIVNKELRDKIGHRQFAQSDHAHDPESDPRGHGLGAHADTKHARMIESIRDCQVIIVRGMGRGAYQAMEQADIRAFVTELGNAEDAVLAYASGSLANHTERLH